MNWISIQDAPWGNNKTAEAESLYFPSKGTRAKKILERDALGLCELSATQVAAMTRSHEADSNTPKSFVHGVKLACLCNRQIKQIRQLRRRASYTNLA